MKVYTIRRVVRKKPLRTPYKRIFWTLEEDIKLIETIRSIGENSWNRVLTTMPHKSEIKCMQRWIQLKESNTAMLEKFLVTGEGLEPS